MTATARSAARRELAIVLALATCGLALVMVVAFAPWYSPAAAPPAVVTTHPVDHPQGVARLRVAVETALRP